jgi:hypothetical protein
MDARVNYFRSIELLCEHLEQDYQQFVAQPQRGGGESVASFSSWINNLEKEKDKKNPLYSYLPTRQRSLFSQRYARK